MVRDDVSTKLIHLTRELTDEDLTEISTIMSNEEFVTDECENFKNIRETQKLIGTHLYIKGRFRCVCFSEAPINTIALLFTEVPTRNFRYTPLGVMVDKEWLYAQSGRPVIYQTEEEYDLLHNDQKYRHMRYEPNINIDYTWEREWRIRIDELQLDPNVTTLIVPTRTWKSYCTFQDERMPGSRIDWHYMVLEDLGINISYPSP